MEVVQTFLPFPSFAESAAVLDDRRLGKQRVEALQILRALHFDDYGWASHPAVRMWRGHARALVAYGLAVVGEWRDRGHRDTTEPSIAEFAAPLPAVPEASLPRGERPPWLGWRPLHRSHQAALVRKDPVVYRGAFPDVSPDDPYVWPEPPAERSEPLPFTSWAVRPASPEVAEAFARADVVGLPTAFSSAEATPKQRRQLTRWCEVARTSDRVALLAGDELRCGALAGPVTAAEADGVPHLARPVRWDRTVRRSALVRPWQLQDPQSLFALRAEAAVESPS